MFKAKAKAKLSKPRQGPKIGSEPPGFDQFRVWPRPEQSVARQVMVALAFPDDSSAADLFHGTMRVKHGGVNERINAHVEKLAEKRQKVDNHDEFCACEEEEMIEQRCNVGRQPHDGVQWTDYDHGLDNVGLNLLKLTLIGD